MCVYVCLCGCASQTLTGRSLGSSTPSPVEGGREGGEETYKLLTGIYELIVSDCKHNNSLPVSACLLIERETETDRKNGRGEEGKKKVRQQNELKKKEVKKGVKNRTVRGWNRQDWDAIQFV